MNRTLIAIMALTLTPAMAAEEWVPQPPEIPTAFISDNWCLIRKYEGGSLYEQRANCSSLVIKSTSLVFNNKEQCTVQSVHRLNGNWWIKGVCSSQEGDRVADYRIYKSSYGLTVLTPPYEPMAR